MTKKSIHYGCHHWVYHVGRMLSDCRSFFRAFSALAFGLWWCVVPGYQKALVHGVPHQHQKENVKIAAKTQSHRSCKPYHHHHHRHHHRCRRHHLISPIIVIAKPKPSILYMFTCCIHCWVAQIGMQMAGQETKGLGGRQHDG